MAADMTRASISVANYNATFKKYPSLIESKGWIHGVWYCGAFYTSTIYGQYPPTFLKRALSLFPGLDESRLLQCPSGTLKGPGVTVDLVSDLIRCPQVVASAEKLPFPDDSFDVWLSDPPYSKEDAKKYGTPPFPLRGMMNEARRVLRPGGYLGLLHFYYPTFRRAEWNMVAMIGVCTGSNRKMRVFCVFQSTKGAESTYEEPKVAAGELF